MKCDNCKMNRLCDELERMGKVPKHENCRCYSPTKPITNHEWLIRKTPEELAEWLSCNCTGDGYGNSAEEWLDWLKQEYFDNKIGEPITIKACDVQLSDKVFPDGLI